MPGHLVTLAPAKAGTAKRAGELLSELDEWFDVSPTAGGRPREGFGSVEVGGHILDLDEAQKAVAVRLDQIDPKWRDSLMVVEAPQG
jgi:hypothetical protein